MRKLVCLLALCACATEQPRVVTDAEMQHALTEGRPAPKPVRSATGFQRTVWGMSRAEVEALYPAKTWETETGYTTMTNYAGYNTFVTFDFSADRLDNAQVLFLPADKLSRGVAQIHYRAVLTSLVERYGTPTPWRTPAPDEHYDAWETDDTMIRVDCSPMTTGRWAGEWGVSINYMSRIYQAEAEANKSQALRHLL